MCLFNCLFNILFFDTIFFQTITLEQLYTAESEANEVSPSNTIPFDLQSSWGLIDEDRRLALYGYTVETINLLVLPMVKTK